MISLPPNCSHFWSVGPALTVALFVLGALAACAKEFDEGEVMVALTAFGTTYATCEGARRHAKKEDGK